MLFWQSKAKKESKRRAAAVSASITVLDLLMHLCPEMADVDTLLDRENAKSKRTLGYVHGFLVQMLMRGCVAPEEASPLIGYVYGHLFAVKGPRLLEHTMSLFHARDAEYDYGAKLAVADIAIWDDSKGEIGPMSLLRIYHPDAAA